MRQRRVKRNHLGFTLLEMAVALLAASVLILATGAFLADHQRAFNDTYDHTYSPAMEADMAARVVFYQTIRQAASSGAASVAADGSWLEVQYYSQPESSALDRSARFYLSGQDLLLERTDLDTGQSLGVQTVCAGGTVDSVVFALTGVSARMFLQLDDGSSTQVVNASAVMRSP
ncbi:MAG: prepilin-type N-terminal cleavage/methylation domain-containing protein [Phycisphaerales bacterium]|nr:MAG: prepilin-type N-terminal cleavage/methylation domain-containing protein [Phycisphaerales bacterium]